MFYLTLHVFIVGCIFKKVNPFEGGGGEERRYFTMEEIKIIC
jgi:hypothetical protein